MAYDLLLHALDICTTHRALHNARRHGKPEEIAQAETAVGEVYEGMDFPKLCRVREWADANLFETKNAHYQTQEERDQEVAIAASIRDKTQALIQEMLREEMLRHEEAHAASRDAGITNSPLTCHVSNVESDSDAV